MAIFKNYDLGAGGVNVDASPIHISTEELLKAQNAIRDPLGVVGGLKNRPGLVKFNSGALAGSVLGGTGVPLVGFDATRLYVAQQDGTVEKWYSSSDLFTTSTAETAVAAWQDPTEYFSTAAGVSRMGALYQGQLYYASAGYTVGSQSPPIRVWNGADDRQLSKVTPTTTKGVMSIIVVHGSLYVLTLDSGTTDADFIGRVLRMDEQGRFTQIGDVLPTGYVPTALTMHHGQLFVGVSRLTVTNEARVYRINPTDETAWTLDNTFAADDYTITDLESFQGLLYATTKNGGAATKGKIVQRSLAGVWATVDSTVNNGGTYESLASFGGYLYASARSYSTLTNTAVVRRSSDGTTWATVYNTTSTDGVGVLTVVGLRLFSMFATKFIHTTSGTSWTLVTLPGANNVDGVIGPLTPRSDTVFFDPNTADATAQDSGVVVNVINPPAGAGSGLITVERTFTLDELINSKSTPISLVSGQSGKLLIPVAATMEMQVVTTFNTGPSFELNFDTDPNATALFTAFAPTNATNRYMLMVRPSASLNFPTGTGFADGYDPTGAGIHFTYPGTQLSSGAGSTARVTLSYRTVTGLV